MSDRRPLRSVWRTMLTRRSLLKVAQVAGVGAAAGGIALVGRDAGAEVKANGICRICTMHCGVVATTRGDRVVRVEGDPASGTRGFLCHHGYALREIVHSPNRLRAPLKREGAAFREISWAQAFEEIAGRLAEVKAKFGPQALAVQTGWPFVRHPLVHLLHRFCQAFGTPNLATVASLCEASLRMGKSLVAGTNLKPDLRHSKTLLVWGANPTFTAPPFAHACSAMALDGRTLIVVDPVRTELASQATLHLRPRPGTDLALALGMAQVLLAEGLIDQKYVEENCLGLEELRALAAKFPPERVEALTSVPREDVARAARLFAQNGPASTWDGLGIEHHPDGVQTVRAVTMLSALCGYLDVPGGQELFHRPGKRFFEEPLPQLYRLATPKPVPPPVTVKPIGYDEHPLYEVYNRQAQAMLFATAILEDKPYPLRALLLIGSNPLVTSPGAARMRAAAEKLSLLVTVDPFLSESAARSDYVLPASTFAEAAVVAAGEDDAKVARSGLVGEQHGSLPDWKIVFELARAVGLGEYFPWSSFQEAIDAPRVPYMVDPAHSPRPDPAPAGTPPPRFPTPSGKIELVSRLMERFGHPALPEWRERQERPETAGPGFPLYLVTGPRTRPYINSQFRHIPSIATKLTEPYAELHPDAARAAGVSDGQRIVVVSPRGKVSMRARVSDRVHPEAVVVPAGWGEASANLLTDPAALDPVSGFPAFRSGVCRVEPG
ncbi:MAG: molybdopterin-containing oxidoreductase family protein [Myxococcaceae bacterium]